MLHRKQSSGNGQKNGYNPASSTGFPKAKWGLWNSRAREKRERGMMGTSVEREHGVMGRKRRERGESRFAFSPLPVTPFVPTFLNN